MPIKVIILSNCSHCPHKYWDRNKQTRWCLLSGSKRIDSAVTTIPKWCELEDYDAKAKKEIDQEREKAEI